MTRPQAHPGSITVARDTSREGSPYRDQNGGAPRAGSAGSARVQGDLTGTLPETPATPGRYPLLVTVALGVAGLLAYVVVFWEASRLLGPASAALALVPVAAAGATLGLRAGVGIALLMSLLNPLLFSVTARSGWEAASTYDLIAYSVAILAAGAIIGRLRDGQRRMAEEGERQRTGFDLERQRLKAAEEALQKRADRYRVLSEAARDAIFLTTTDGKLVEANQAALDFTGYTREELLELEARDLYIFPADREWIQAELEKTGEEALPDPVVSALEVKLRRKDGTELDCLETDRVWRNGEGGIAGYQTTITDTSAQRRLEEAVSREAEGLRLAMEAARMATWQMDLQGGSAIIASDNLEPLLGLAEGAFDGSYESLLNCIHQDDRLFVKRAVARAVEKQGDLRLEARIGLPAGEIRWIAMRANLAQDRAGNPSRLIGTFIDITERRKAEEKAEHLGYYDPLTELPNRRLFNERIAAALGQANRTGRMVAVLNLDLDRFKVVNDTLGHAAGDRLLQEVAERLTDCVRVHDTVARQGGDEFMVLSPSIAGIEEADRIAQRILEGLKEPFHLAGRDLHVSASIGISVYPEDGDGPEPLLRNADAAMYRVKQAGRDGYQFHTSAMYAEAFGKLELETRLRQALEREEFLVYYQPQVSIQTGQIIGVEALLRWQGAAGELFPPGEFIAMAEDNGLIVPLGEWVLRAACAQTQAWREAGLPPLRVAVNISARQFQQPNLVGRVRAIVEESGLDPQLLKLEITESTAMADVEHTRAILGELAELGIKASLDDFGTGHASLKYLKDFPLHSLKIDQSFVAGIPTDSSSTAITTAVIGLGHALGLEVIAEGVETAEQLEVLRARGCDTFQGYLCSRALPAQELAQLLPETDSGERL